MVSAARLLDLKTVRYFVCWASSRLICEIVILRWGKFLPSKLTFCKSTEQHLCSPWQVPLPDLPLSREGPLPSSTKMPTDASRRFCPHHYHGFVSTDMFWLGNSVNHQGTLAVFSKTPTLRPCGCGARKVKMNWVGSLVLRQETGP